MKNFYRVLILFTFLSQGLSEISNAQWWQPTSTTNLKLLYDYDNVAPFVIFDAQDLTSSLITDDDISFFNPNLNTYGGYVVSTWPWYFAKFYFNGVSDIGIDTGWVLSTGRVFLMEPIGQTDGPGTYCGIGFPASYTSTGPNLGVSFYGEPTSAGPGGTGPFGTHRFAQYPELTALNNGDSVRDANVLDFDFVPKGDHIRLQYVFASEEYPGNGCTEPNDVMGIFLSGPGISGYQTLSLVPGTSLPVGVNTVNPLGVNCENNQNYSQYYVDNTNGQNVIFDGFTTVLTAWAEVSPCDTYHLRIAVADGAWHDGGCDTLVEYNMIDHDTHCMGLYDSGIFLKQHSFRSTDSLRVEARGGVAGDTLAPYAVRGCLPGAFRLCRLRPDPFPLELTYSLSGSAINGTDYGTLSGMAVIPANTSFVDVPVHALLPGGAAGPKTVKLILQSPYSSCSAMALPDADSAALTIYEALYAQIPQTDTTICTGCSTQILVEGDPALQYSWTPATGLNNATLQSPVASPPQTTQYFMTASQTAPGSCPPVQDSIYVYVGNVGIHEIHAYSGISIVPNPFRESFQLKTSHEDKDEYILSLSPISGKELMTLRGSILQINRKLASAIKELAPGNYILHIQNKRSLQQATFKPVKIK